MFSIATRRAPVTTLARAYTSSLREGSVAQSKEFGKKERAHEEEYARRHDAELLRKLKSEIEEKQKQLVRCEFGQQLKRLTLLSKNANESLQAELESKVKNTESK